LDLDRKIKHRFEELDDEDSPYYWARYTHTPFILTYRKGFPQAFYNGKIDSKHLKFYFENLAHIKGHKENKVIPVKLSYNKNIYLRTTYE
jgi:hypothetical protein